MTKTTIPARGISSSKTNRPENLASCSLLTVIAIPGIKAIKAYTVASVIGTTAVPVILNNKIAGLGLDQVQKR